MALSTEQVFDAVAPAYASDPDKGTHIELAELSTSTCAFGLNYNKAVALRAAHTIEIAKGSDLAGSGGSGPIASKKEGSLSLSYSKATSSGASPSDLQSTKYGRQLLELIRGNVAPVGVTGGVDTGCING